MRALYLSHTGMTEPLGRSQVLPYVRGLRQAGADMEILSFEPESASDQAIAATREELAALGIGYHHFRRSSSHSLFVKGSESLKAFVTALSRALGSRPDLVHARSYLPAAVAYGIARIAPRTRLLFDCRGLLGDEYVDAGHWSRSSISYRLTKVAERRLFARADGVVVLTDRLAQWLKNEAKLVPQETPIEVVPCCVDLDRFRFDADERERARGELQAGDRFVLAYSGTLGSWYREEEMVGLFARLRARRPALFLVLTRSNTSRLRDLLARAGVSAEDVAIFAAEPQRMPALLAAADGAVSFIDPCFSKMASSPTKVGEYLAVGLPVAMNRMVGDSDRLIAEIPAIVDAGTLTSDDLEQAATRLITQAGLENIRAQARAAAERHFSLEQVGVARYRRLYERLTRD